MYRKYFKRLIDISLSALLIVVFSPIMIVVCIIVLFGLGRPVFFIQKRVTLHEKPFNIIKFRTMKLETDKSGRNLSMEERNSKVGNVLRSLSIDELPELINILKGDLSFVGPRPLFEDYLPYYTNQEKKRHNIRGGLIPPDCFEGKVNVTWDEQLKWEAWYSENVTIKNDFKVIILTFRIVLMRIKEDYGSERRGSLIEERSNETTRNM